MFIKEKYKSVIYSWKQDVLTMKFIKICFVVWSVLWVVFFLKENKEGEYRSFFDMMPLGLEEKRAYLLGEDLYSFLSFARNDLPPDARYKIEGLPEFSIEEVRAIYYMAPYRAVEEDYDHILVFGQAGYSEDGFVRSSGVSEKNYILRKKKWDRQE